MGSEQVLLDIGIALGSDHGRIHTEVELETFLQDLGRLNGEQGGTQLHNFAVFENRGYQAMAVSHPCPTSNKVCGAPISRPARAIWWYGLLHAPGSTPVHAVNAVLNASTQETIIQWCQARHVTELYIDQWSSPDPAIQASFEEFVLRADNASIDLQLYVGEVEDATRGGVPETVARVAAWCKSHPMMCGQRLSTTPHFSGGYIFASREAAAACCVLRGMRLCRKAELVGHSLCEAGWCSDWEGFWMDHASQGCGHAGFNAHSGKAGAWCCEE